MRLPLEKRNAKNSIRNTRTASLLRGDMPREPIGLKLPCQGVSRGPVKGAESSCGPNRLLVCRGADCQSEPFSSQKPGATTYDFFELFFIGGRNFQHREKGFLRNINLADALHAAFALFLFFEELAFARDVATVAFGQDVFAVRCHRFPSSEGRRVGKARQCGAGT